MINAVIFDADGVVICREKYFSERAGLPFEKVNPFFEGVFQRCLVGRADLRIELAKNIKSWGWKGTLDDLLEFWFSGEKKTDDVIMQYVLNLKGKGFKVFLATNNEKYRVEYLLKELDLEKKFDKIYASGYMGYKKPDTTFFRYILNDQNMKPEEVLVWDDDIEHVVSARKLGIQAEIFTSIDYFEERMKKYF